MRPAAALLLLGFSMFSCCCHCDLVLVYSVSRHGARNVLPKSSLLAESEATGGPTLLPQGQKQCYEAGGSSTASAAAAAAAGSVVVIWAMP